MSTQRAKPLPERCECGQSLRVLFENRREAVMKCSANHQVNVPAPMPTRVHHDDANGRLLRAADKRSRKAARRKVSA